MAEVLAQSCFRCASPLHPSDVRCARCGARKPAEGWPADARIGSAFLDRLVIRKRLGHGATGAVYLAEDPESGARVAVKFLHRTLVADDELVKRFRVEAVVTKALGIPQVVQTYDFGATEDGTHYLTMEYVAGHNLADLMAGGALHLDDALEISRQVLIALDVAHRRHVIHRDLKPGNILLTHSEDGRPLVKILDFGFAKVLCENAEGFFYPVKVTRDRVVMGTPRYMSPEQARGERDLDGRTDLYSFGVILYQMATGVTPFDAENPMDVLAKHLEETPRRPSEVAPGLPDALDPIVLRLLEKPRERRYACAADVLEALDRAFPGSRSAWRLDEVAARAARPSQILRQVGQLVEEPVPIPEAPRRRLPWAIILAIAGGVALAGLALWWSLT